MELDGSSNPATPIGPAFSTPYSERINAAKNDRPPEGSQNALERSEALKAFLFSDHVASPPTTTTLPAPGASPLTKYPTNSPHQRRSPASTSSTQHNGFSPAPDRRAANYAKGSVRTSGLRQEVTPTKTPTTTPNRNAQFANSPTPPRIYGNVTNSNSGNFIGNSTPHAASPSPAIPYDVSSGNRNTQIQGMEDSLRKILKLDSSSGQGVTGGGMAPGAYVGDINNGVMRS